MIFPSPPPLPLLSNTTQWNDSSQSASYFYQEEEEEEGRVPRNVVKIPPNTSHLPPPNISWEARLR